jgi:uncharacterized protein (DUF486 family)
MPSAFWQATGLLILSNVFMTFAWYAHLKTLNGRPWLVAALASWGIALVEYLFQVPGNRIGYTVMSLPQLKILQEVITLLVFVPFVLVYMKQGLKLDYLWAALCILGAVYFVFRSARRPRSTAASTRSAPGATRASSRASARAGPCWASGRSCPATACCCRTRSCRRSTTCGTGRARPSSRTWRRSATRCSP